MRKRSSCGSAKAVAPRQSAAGAIATLKARNPRREISSAVEEARCRSGWTARENRTASCAAANRARQHEHRWHKEKVPDKDRGGQRFAEKGIKSAVGRAAENDEGEAGKLNCKKNRNADAPRARLPSCCEGNDASATSRPRPR
jgi:hypothetical protein